MRDHIYNLIFNLFIISFCFISCHSKENKVRFTIEEALEYAQQQQKNVIVWHYWENEADTSDYFEQIEKKYASDTLFQQKYILVYHIANVVGNEMLSRSLQDRKRALLLEISPDLELKTIRLSTKQGLQLALDSLVAGFPAIEYYPDSLYVSGESYRTVVSYSLKAYLALKKKQKDQMAAAIHEIRNDSLVFYNCYLAAKICEGLGEKENAERYARTALQLYEHSDHFLYYPLCEELYFILGKDERKGKEKKNLVFRETLKDCGKVKANTKCEIDYEFKNIGETPVLIKNIEKGCHCMEVSWELKPILPGETGHIKVIHEAGQKGVFSKMLAVFTNENSQKIFLSYKGRVY